MSNFSYVYGVHAVKALMSNPIRSTKILYVNEDRMDERIQEVLALANKANVPVEKLTFQKMNQRFSEFAHQGVVAFADPLPSYTEQDIARLLQLTKAPHLILILDGITDPHNLGACLRVADAAGVNFVIVPKDKSASITPVVSKVACGAAESIPLIRVTNLVRAIDLLKKEGIWVYGAAGEAKQTIYQLDYRSSIALIMGSEGEGMRRLTREHCDGLFALPMYGTVESLNVSVATGVCLYEVVRQRQ